MEKFFVKNYNLLRGGSSLINKAKKFMENINFSENEVIEKINEQRENQDCLTINELLNITDNIIYDPFSTIISKKVKIGKGNIFYPNIVITADEQSSIEIGDNNIFGNSTSIQATNESEILVGSNCRIDGKVSIYGSCKIQNGSQILGFIQVYDCTLEQGGSYLEKDPNLRGGVLKGVGRAKNLYVKQGHVINGLGDFKQEQEELQIKYHPINK